MPDISDSEEGALVLRDIAKEAELLRKSAVDMRRQTISGGGREGPKVPAFLRRLLAPTRETKAE